MNKFTRLADDIYTLKIEGEQKPLNVTSEHPFYTKVYQDGYSNDAEWKEVKSLKANDKVKLASSKWAKILEVKFKGKGQVYNFSVAENHNYFVGDSRLLTHNICKAAKDVGLPTQGRVRYVPPKNWHKTEPLPRGPNGGYIDRHGNEWVKGPSRTAGQPYEWDVTPGTSGLQWAAKDGTHLNVSLDGKITH